MFKLMNKKIVAILHPKILLLLTDMFNNTFYIIMYETDSASCIKFFQQKHTVKLVLSGLPKIDKTKVLMTNGSLMKVESIAECSLGAFCNTFDLH